MKEAESVRDSEDSTSESFNYDGQLLANRQNKFTLLSNPSAEPVLIYCSKRKGKMIRKSSARTSTIYNTNKRIRGLIRKMECNATFEEQVISLVQKSLELGGLSAKKLDAIVASALYLVHRLNHSQIFLSQIIRVFNVRSADISKCLTSFKKLGLYQEVDILSLWTIYAQLVDYWFPYGSVAMESDKEESKSELEFAIEPAKIVSSCALPVANKKEELVPKSFRSQMLDIGRILTELPEIDLAKQGKLPQTFAAGIFMVAAKYYQLSIQQRDVAKRLSICTSTVTQSKRLIMDILLKKAMGEKMEEGKEVGNKWKLVAGLIEGFLGISNKT